MTSSVTADLSQTHLSLPPIQNIMLVIPMLITHNTDYFRENLTLEINKNNKLTPVSVYYYRNVVFILMLLYTDQMWKVSILPKF